MRTLKKALEDIKIAVYSKKDSSISDIRLLIKEKCEEYI